MLSPTDEPVQKFINRTKDLLTLEKDCEVEETQNTLKQLTSKELAKRGLAITMVVVVEECTGLYGKYIVTLQSKRKDEPLTKGHRIQPGDIVGLKDETSGDIVDSGVVFKVFEKSIQIALKKPNDDASLSIIPTLSIVLLTNDITFRRMDKTLDDIPKKSDSHVLELLFTDHGQPLDNSPINFTPVNQNLNKPQVDAISFALGSKDIALIHGPPGTGKTTTIVEFIIQAVKLGNKVLACAPSNIAVDNIAEKLLELKDPNVNLVRVGHPARFLPSVLSHCLEEIVSHSNAAQVVRELRKEMDDVQKKIKSMASWEREKKWDDWRSLKKDLRIREQKCVEQTIESCNVVLATCTGAADKYLKKFDKFDIVIVDEAGQGLEPVCWIPMLKGKRFVLAGDHLQLPPTIHSDNAAKKGLSTTLFERIIKSKIGPKVSKLLSVQYRMNEKIMEWSSRYLYDSKLKAHECVAHHLLSDLEGVKTTDNTKVPLILIDTLRCFLDEQQDSEGSKYNEGEANIVKKYITDLVSSGVEERHISVITPYFAQVRFIRNLIRKDYPMVEVNTVDGFQGREKEVIIISMVRSNNDKEVGFLEERRRMNVAVTRAKRQCCIVCDTRTVTSNKFLANMVKYFQNNGDYLSANQFLPQSPNISTTTTTTTTTTTATTDNTVKDNNPQPIQNVNTTDSKKQDILDKLKKFKSQQQLQQQKSSQPTSLDLESPISKALITFVEEECKRLDLYCQITERKGHNYATIFLEKPIKQQDNESEESNQDDDEDEGKVPVITSSTTSTSTSQKKKKPKKKPAQPNNNTTTNNNNNTKTTSNKFQDLEKQSKELTEDELLDLMIMNNDRCFLSGCKTSTKLMSQICDYCREKYCYHHSLPHQHGCSSAVQKAHQQNLRNQMLGGASSSKPLRPGQRLGLENKLQKKLDNASQSRTKKPSSKDAKKS
eukprot:TRINITY_DN606_c1_g2_i1.p1 TRINITY_DN606_c1_g2~~TRINITY_DN606_c1_g2_i1.p1  ORF type:complete len:942 (-),score=217.78 TRINITY_DN606_c1_g2_i1:198-3023(-)